MSNSKIMEKLVYRYIIYGDTLLNKITYFIRIILLTIIFNYFYELMFIRYLYLYILYSLYILLNYIYRNIYMYTINLHVHIFLELNLYISIFQNSKMGRE